MILWFTVLLWNIWIKWHYPKWEVAKIFIRTRNLFCDKYYETLDKAWIFWLRQLNMPEYTLFYKKHFYKQHQAEIG